MTELSDPVGSIEVAGLLGVRPDTVVQWRQRSWINFPEPRWVVSGRPAWAWGEVLAWAVKSNRGRLTLEMLEEAQQWVSQ